MKNALAYILLFSLTVAFSYSQLITKNQQSGDSVMVFKASSSVCPLIFSSDVASKSSYSPTDEGCTFDIPLFEIEEENGISFLKKNAHSIGVFAKINHWFSQLDYFSFSGDISSEPTHFSHSSERYISLQVFRL